MKQHRWTLLAFLALFMAYIAVTRFVSYEVPPQKLSPPPKNCLDKASPQSQPSETVNGEPLETCADLDAINQVYLRNIKPIFETKCLMCHGAVNRLPLYAKIPPASWLVQSDIQEAKRHSDMSFDFPFVGKDIDVPQDGLEDLMDIVQQNAMPPLQYKLMHWQSGLTKEESDKILNWANAGLKKLND